MPVGLLVIQQSEDEAWVVLVEGKGLHMNSVIKSPWFENLPLEEFLSKLESDCGAELEECDMYYCGTFVKFNVEMKTVITLQKED